jgi:hypothetical protein
MMVPIPPFFDHGIPLYLGGIHDERHVDDACVVAQDVDWPEVACHRLHHGVNLISPGDIDRHPDGPHPRALSSSTAVESA